MATDTDVLDADSDGAPVDEFLCSAFIDHRAEARCPLTGIQQRRGRCEHVVEQAHGAKLTAFRQMYTQQIVINGDRDQIEKSDLITHGNPYVRVFDLPPRQFGQFEQRPHRHTSSLAVCIGDSRGDSQRLGKSRRALHAPFIRDLPLYSDRVARTNKFLSDADKTPINGRTYKARLFTPEPSCVLAPHMTGGSAVVLDLFFMDSKNKTIAVVDDDAGIRQSLERLLSLVGYRVRTFACAGDFLEAMKTGTVHCIVVDINLGATSGLDLAEHPVVAGAKIPLIFISGVVEHRTRARAAAAGCIALLSKPFKPIELLDAIFRATQDSLPIP